MSIPASLNQRSWILALDWHIRFALGVSTCSLEDTAAAERALKTLQKRTGKVPFNNDTYARLNAFLSGMVDQSKGSLDSALTTYSSRLLCLPDNVANYTDFNTDITILATMNRLLILQDPTHPDHFLASVLFSTLEPFCSTHPNVFISGVFKILRSLVSLDNSIDRQKTLTFNAMETAKQLRNDKLMALCLINMTHRFFADAIGEKAVKSVRAARQIANRSKSVLWRTVALGLCINTFQRNGLVQDAQGCVQALEGLRERLPPTLKSDFMGRSGNGGMVRMTDGQGDVIMK